MNASSYKRIEIEKHKKREGIANGIERQIRVKQIVQPKQEQKVKKKTWEIQRMAKKIKIEHRMEYL